MKILAVVITVFLYTNLYAGIEDKIVGIIDVVKIDKEYHVRFTEEGENAIKELCREVIKEELAVPPLSIETINSRSLSDRSFVDHLIAF